MVKIWAKLIKDDRIVNQFVLEDFCSMDYSKFYEYVRTICENLDIPTPVVIKTHIFNYAKYNVVKFLQNDFVERFDYDKLVLENLFA